MRVLFFTDVVRHFGFDPLGVMSLSSCLRAAGHRTRLVQRPRSWSHVRDEVRAFDPGILAFSTTTGAHRYYLELNRRIRSECRAFSLFGGAHPTFYPDMLSAPGVDAVCVGEGEQALVELAEALDSGSPPTGIANLWVKDPDGAIHRNPIRPLVGDLDSLPVPDRELVYAARASQHHHGIVTMLAGRGCPYGCTYCHNHIYKRLYAGRGRLVRRRSAAHVVAEAQALREEYAPKMVVFSDDCLVLDRTWLRQFCVAWASEVKLPFMGNARFDLLDEETTRLLSEAGCSTVVASVEAGNDRLREQILKRRMSREQILRGAELVRQQGMGLLVQGILGLPRGSLRADLETLELVAQTHPSNASVTMFQPYPGTELGDLARAEGLCSVEVNEIPETFRAGSVLDLPEKTQQERLHAVFGLAAEFPLVRRAVPMLLRLPVQTVGRFLTRAWNGYCARYRLYPVLDYSFGATVMNALRYLAHRGG